MPGEGEADEAVEELLVRHRGFGLVGVTDDPAEQFPGGDRLLHQDDVVIPERLVDGAVLAVGHTRDNAALVS